MRSCIIVNILRLLFKFTFTFTDVAITNDYTRNKCSYNIAMESCPTSHNTILNNISQCIVSLPLYQVNNSQLAHKARWDRSAQSRQMNATRTGNQFQLIQYASPSQCKSICKRSANHALNSLFVEAAVSHNTQY